MVGLRYTRYRKVFLNVMSWIKCINMILPEKAGFYARNEYKKRLPCHAVNTVTYDCLDVAH